MIRQAKWSDMDAIDAIEQHVHIAPWSREILNTCLSAGYDIRVMTTDEDVIIGYIVMRYQNEVAHLLNIGIAASVQRKGYGRKLLEHSLHTLSQNPNIHSVMLEVRPSNHIALHLYYSLGFACIDTKKNYYTTEDALVLKKTNSM